MKNHHNIDTLKLALDHLIALGFIEPELDVVKEAIKKLQDAIKEVDELRKIAKMASSVARHKPVVSKHIRSSVIENDFERLKTLLREYKGI